MKDRLTQLLEQFKDANPATRMALVVSTLVIVALAGFSSWYANRPDFTEIWTGLSSAQAASYKGALAEAGIPFRSSPPPENGIWVNSNQRTEAEAAVAIGGVAPISRGISTGESGATSAFMSANARQQMQQKRDWQECELLLETLDFVNSATVVGSGDDQTPFTRGEPQTISVTLDLQHGSSLTAAQNQNVAKMVRTRFSVPMENITIVDRHGNLLHDGMALGEGGSTDDLLDHKRRFEEIAQRKANDHLERALGSGMAYVTVNAEWDNEQVEKISNTVTPVKGAVINERVTTSKTPVSGSSVGGPTGVSANIKPDFGAKNAGVPPPGGGSSGTAETSDKETQSVVGTAVEHSRNQRPRIKRLSVAMTVDSSVATDLESLAEMVKSAVGFDETRNDQFKSFVTTLASLERDEAGNPIAPAKPEPVAPPNEYLLLALEHGVEILAALAFVFILLKSMRGAKDAAGKGGKKGSAAVIAAREAQEAEAAAAEHIDPSLLARAQVEELVRSDPERVSEILAQWARDELEQVGAP
jgi:flagellar M-ring protein FliF